MDEVKQWLLAPDPESGRAASMPVKLEGKTAKPASKSMPQSPPARPQRPQSAGKQLWMHSTDLHYARDQIHPDFPEASAYAAVSHSGTDLATSKVAIRIVLANCELGAESFS